MAIPPVQVVYYAAVCRPEEAGTKAAANRPLSDFFLSSRDNGKSI
jgi:hypothetical protein